MKIWGQAAENVREAFIAAALELGINAYEAEMFFISVRDDVADTGPAALKLRLEYTRGKESASTESQNEHRVATYQSRFRQILMNTGLVNGVGVLVQRELVEELDWQIGLQFKSIREAKAPQKARQLDSQPMSTAIA
jgi:hypothetical protein